MRESVIFSLKRCCVWVTVSQSVTFVCIHLYNMIVGGRIRAKARKTAKEWRRERHTQTHIDTKTELITGNCDRCGKGSLSTTAPLHYFSEKQKKKSFALGLLPLINKYITHCLISSHRRKHKHSNFTMRHEIRRKTKINDPRGRDHLPVISQQC